tara:strand:- start:1243 stop:1449 length:207 start_codon:yes stop_codon:yes gene_type:complete
MVAETVKPNDKASIYWDDLTPEEKKFLTAFRNSTSERQEIAERILKLFNDENIKKHIPYLPAPCLMTL